MADILLQKPVAGTTTIAPQAEDRLAFSFDSAEATLTRDDNNLVMSFEDGSAIHLTNFYEAYTSENMPTFLIEGAEVDGESFFAALGEELMPAAGTTTAAAQGSGSSVDTLAGTLLEGINRLDGLDQDYPRSNEQEQPREAAGDGASGTPTGNSASATTQTQAPADMAPIAQADENTLQEGGHITGNILDNDSAGDGNALTGKELVDVTAPEGWEPVTKELCDELGVDSEKLEGSFTFYDPNTNEVLIVQKDGSYTFESPSNSLSEDKTLDFNYTIKDADGDISESTLTIHVESVDDATTLDFTGPDGSNANYTTHDDAFDDNASEGSTKLVEGSFTAGKGDGETTITITFGSENIVLDADSLTPEGGAFGSITTENGTFTVTAYDAATGEVRYRYEQSDAADHSGGAVQEEFTVTVSDNDDNSADDATGNITINIVDDVVSAQSDSVTLHEEDITSETLVSGNLLTNDDVSADTGTTVVDIKAPSEDWTGGRTESGWTFESDAGVITFGEDGSYTFDPSDDYPIATDQDFSFGYTAQDSDGSTSSAELDLSIKADHGELETSDLATEVVTLNLAVIVDSSGSMNASAMDAIEEALEALGHSLDSLNSSAVEINLCLIDYNKGAQVQLQVSSDDLTQDNAFENLLSGVEWSGGGKEGTNMDAAFEAATGWFNSLGQDAIDSSINKTIFMTDGQPTYALEDTVTYDLKTDNRDADSDILLTVTLDGKTYTLENYEIHQYDASAGLAHDAVFTYKAEDGSILTCVQDNGGSGKGNMWFEGEQDVIFDANGNPVVKESGPLVLDKDAVQQGAENTIEYNGETYTLETSYTHDYGNSWYANDGYSTYVNADGDIITCLHDAGSSGAGDVWYEGSVDIDFSSKGNPSVSSKPLDVQEGEAFSNTVNVQGKTLNSATDIADGADGHTWTGNGVEYRLVQSESANGTAIGAPTLQANVAGSWVSVGTVGVITDGSGDYASDNEMTHTQESAEALDKAMGYDTEEGESGLFAVGFGSNYNDSFLKTITIDGQLYNTNDLTEAFNDIMSVVAREVALQMEQAVVDVINEALGQVAGEDASISADDISSVVDLAEQGEYALLDDISNSLENTVAEDMKDGVDVDLNGDGIISDDELGVQMEFDNQNSQGSEEDDLLVSFGGSDTINAGDGHDVVFGGAGDDELHGEAGNDYLHGGSGNDVIYGGDGDDVIDGGIGSDILEGGAGDDLILANINDTVHGGSGNDTIDLRGLDGDSLDLSNLLIDGGSEDDGTPGMDVLLTDKNTNVDAMLENGTLSNVEVIVQGSQDANEATAKEALESIENGSFDGTGWNNTGSIQGANGTTFDKFESDDGLTILVQQTLLNTTM